MTRNMNINRTIPLLCLFVLFFSCKKTDSNDNNNIPIDNWIPDTYYLSLQDKSLFDFYYTSKTIYFLDSAGNNLNFQTDSLYDITTHQESNLNAGEVLRIIYQCQTNYFPNYKIILFLNAKPDSAVNLDIYFGTGTYWSDQGNDWVTSDFSYNPKWPHNVDSIDSLGYLYHYDFLDSITLQNKTFYNVFYSKNETINTDIKQTIQCYYTNDKGLVAFRNLDGEFWVRQ